MSDTPLVVVLILFGGYGFACGIFICWRVIKWALRP